MHNSSLISCRTDTLCGSGNLALGAEDARHRDRSITMAKSTDQLDPVRFFEAKLLLKPDRVSSIEGFHDLDSKTRRTAESLRIDFLEDAAARRAPEVREIVFVDTPEFDLYKSGFILRRRISYVDGFPAGEPEIVFKYRYSDQQRAAAVDVRPRISGKYRVKLKAQALPLKDEIGGYRMLYSHNSIFGISQTHETDRTAMSTLTRIFPVLSALKNTQGERVQLVNEGIVEELLLPLGKLDFGKGLVAKSSVSLWRTRGEHVPLIGEYSFRAKFDHIEDVSPKAKKLLTQYFVQLQHDVKSWVAIGATKTGLVYGLKGKAPEREG
jgi:hypothetical protein